MLRSTCHSTCLGNLTPVTLATCIWASPKKTGFSIPSSRILSHPLHDARRDQPVKVVLHLPRQASPCEQNTEFHVDSEGILREIGRGQKQPPAIRHCTLDVQDAELVAVAVTF